MVEVRAPRVSDCRYLAEHLREGDRLELLASAGDDLERSIYRAVAVSSHRFTAERRGRVIAIFGFAPISLIGGIGSPWLLGTPEVDRVPGALTRLTLQHIAQVRQVYPTLVNYVDARNVRSIRWLERLGFAVDRKPVPVGLEGTAFYRFEMRA